MFVLNNFLFSFKIWLSDETFIYGLLMAIKNSQKMRAMVVYFYTTMTSRHGNTFCITRVLLKTHVWPLDSPFKRPVFPRIDTSFAVSPNKLLNEQSSWHRIWTPWRSCDYTLMLCRNILMQSDNIARSVWCSISYVKFRVSNCIIFRFISIGDAYLS